MTTNEHVHRWSTGSVVLVVICTAAVCATVVWSEMLFYQQLREDIRSLSERWTLRVEKEVDTLNARLSRLPPKELVQAATVALEMAKDQEKRLDHVEGRVGVAER